MTHLQTVMKLFRKIYKEGLLQTVIKIQREKIENTIFLKKKAVDVYFSCIKIEQFKTAENFAKLVALRVGEDPVTYLQIVKDTVLDYFFRDFTREPLRNVRMGAYFFDTENEKYVRFNGTEEHYKKVWRCERGILMDNKAWRKEMLKKHGRKYLGLSEEEAGEVRRGVFCPPDLNFGIQELQQEVFKVLFNPGKEKK